MFISCLLFPATEADVKRQQERAEERQASRWEAMELREQLQQAQRERDDARAQLWRLRDTVEAAAAAEVATSGCLFQLCVYCSVLKVASV